MTSEDFEKTVRGLSFGESVVIDGNRYTRTIGGLIYSNFSGTACCFIPDGKPKTFESEVVKKDLTTGTKRRTKGSL